MTENKCVGCIHYRPYSKREGSNEWECKWGMTFAYECINDGYSKKQKPCPFCGSVKISAFVPTAYEPGELASISCKNPICGAEVRGHTLDEVMAKWNRRVNE